MEWHQFNSNNIGTIVFGASQIAGDRAMQIQYNAAKNAGMNIIVVNNWRELKVDLTKKNKKFQNLFFANHGYAAGKYMQFFGDPYLAGDLEENAEAIKGVGDFTKNVVLLGCFEGADKLSTESPDENESVIDKVETRMKFITLINKPVYSNRGYGAIHPRMFDGSGYQFLIGAAPRAAAWENKLNEISHGWRLDKPNGDHSDFTSLAPTARGGITVIDFKVFKKSIENAANGIKDYFKNNLPPTKQSNSGRAKDNWNLQTN